MNLMKEAVSSVDITKYRENISENTKDLLVVEEPLEIRLKYFDGIDFKEKRIAVTMRTPGNDFELAFGFLLTEGIISFYKEIEKIFYCEDIQSPDEEGNVVIVHMSKNVRIEDSVFNRNFYINSSCGVCGKSSLESIEIVCQTSFDDEKPKIPIELIHNMPDITGRNQSVFKHTGALHAAALFNMAGELQLIREDVGRHNALDKVIGARAIEEKGNDEFALFVSGRAGFELVQKAVVAGIPIMVSVGAPSSLAVDLANSYNQTLVGFARNGKFNVYSGQSRVGD